MVFTLTNPPIGLENENFLDSTVISNEYEFGGGTKDSTKNERRP